MNAPNRDGRTVGRTLYNGHVLPIVLPTGDVIEFEWHGGRGRAQVRVPAGVVVGTPVFLNDRNLDDGEDRR